MKSIKLPNGAWSYDESQRLGGAGGFASVYAGLSADGKPVAVKIFHASKSGQADRELEFARGRLGKSSPHLIPIYDCGLDSLTGEPAIVMARGDRNLAEHLRTTGPLSEPDACAIGLQIIEGLIEASEWVHRDLKPQNVIRCDGRWQVSDFGIGRRANALTASGTMKGYLSMPYAAPEQWDSERSTHATDVYALACLIHELLTGKTLFDGPEEHDFARQHRSELAPVSAGSPRLQSLLHRMLAKGQAGRPRVEEVRARLEGLPAALAAGRASPLSQASAAVSQQEAQREAASQQARRRQAERRAMKDHGVSILRRISNELFERIRSEAPMAQVDHPGGGARRAELGQGALTMSVGHQVDVPREVFAQSGWDVVCADYIHVEQPGYTRGASLWYVNDGSAAWRWLEVGYYCWGSTGNPGGEPCSLPPGRDADLAASMTMHRWQHAYKPRQIEGAATDLFIDRWMAFLAAAASGGLSRPSQFPEDS